MKRWIVRIMLAPALLVVGISLHPAMPVYAKEMWIMDKVVLTDYRWLG